MLGRRAKLHLFVTFRCNPWAFAPLNTTPLYLLVGELASSGKEGLRLRKEGTNAEKREPLLPTPLCYL